MPDGTRVAAYIEIVHDSAEKTEKGFNTVKLITATQAFRKYDWLRKIPVKNFKGNLRGMVISGKWRTVYEVTSDMKEIAGNIVLLTAFAGSLLEERRRIEKIWNSQDDGFLKGLQFAAIAGTAAERALSGAVTGITSLLFLSLQGYGMMGEFSPKTASYSQACVKYLRDADASVKSWVQTWTDTEKQAEAFYHVTAHFAF